MAAAKKGKCLGRCGAQQNLRNLYSLDIYAQVWVIKKTRKKSVKGQQNTLKAKNELNIFLRC